MARTYPYGYGSWATRLTLNELNGRVTWSNLDPEFRRRLLALFDHAQDVGRDLGIGGGWRSSAQQEQVFRERYHVVTCPGQISWNGQCWVKNPGVAPSAPPGRSYHETTTPSGAIAADLIGDIGWADTIAKLFGLRSLADLLPPNNELWHHQPLEVPTARRNYNGAPLTRFPLPGDNPTPPPPEPEPEPEDDVSENLIYYPTRQSTPGDPNWTVMREVGLELSGIDGEYADKALPVYEAKAGEILLTEPLELNRFIERHAIIGEPPSSLPAEATDIWNARKDR